MSTQILIIGAASKIAQALINELTSTQADTNVYAVSRSQPESFELQSSKVHYLQCDYSAAAISALINELNPNLSDLTQVYICNGILHGREISTNNNQHFAPEKMLEELTIEQFTHVLQVNALLPMIWIQSLVKALNFKQPCCICAFSARVGSIEDNYLGGWYSYRSSKAALNMLLKTAAIELKRRAHHIKLVAFHPGTTDTPLSKPFQKRVPQDKLFTPKFVAQQLIGIIKDIEYDNKLSYLDWQGQAIAW
jgi:NAD(P)-dependent dehydrogenase (short-subunit alcohol dehydrogenase family)